MFNNCFILRVNYAQKEATKTETNVYLNREDVEKYDRCNIPSLFRRAS